MAIHSTSTSGTVEQHGSSGTGTERPVWTVVARVVAWLILLGGLAGAGVGVAGLKVELTVAGLILACTAALILLKLRADAKL
ncbi:hypothetical protein [Nocardia stercoris]|uniref:hypothetical protein n=1 Tax=Nocardia stercoris TaxID=2483361 RepID=UPI0011C43202|nr:hypothetical protein [Nocardia stercoris]